MKKTIVLLMAICGLMTLSSCKNVTWSQVQTQIASWVSLESTTAIIVSNTLEKHPDSLDLFKKITDDLIVLSDKEVLTLTDVKKDIETRITDSKLPCKAEIILVVDKIFNKISAGPQFDVAKHKGEILDIASGIDWAVKFYEEKHNVGQVTVTK